MKHDSEYEFIELKLSEKLRSIDAGVLVNAYLYLNPDLSQATIAKPVFGISAPALGKALKVTGDNLRDDWQGIVKGLLEKTDLSDLQRKINHIARTQDYAMLIKTREMLIALASEYLRTLGIKPILYNNFFPDYRSFMLKDQNSKAAWIFVVPDNLVDSNCLPISFEEYRNKLLDFYADDVTMAIFATPYALRIRKISLDGLPSPVKLGAVHQVVIMQMTEDYTKLIGAYQWFVERKEFSPEEYEADAPVPTDNDAPYVNEEQINPLPRQNAEE